jgi:ABC-type nitrate/sulfonate/bicarbonate transport system substrate-binding protein
VLGLFHRAGQHVSLLVNQRLIADGSAVSWIRGSAQHADAMAITVQLDWKPNAQFAGLLLAVHHGWFADAGVEVTIRPWRPATDPLEQVPAQPGLIAVSEDNLAIRSAAAGNQLKVLGSMLQRSPLAWMVLESSPITEFSQFAASRIGVHVDGVTGLQFAMKTAGLDLDAADVLEVPYDKMEQLRVGAIEVCQCNGLVEPIEMAAAGVPVRVLWACEVGYSVYSQVLTTSAATIAAQPEELDAFMKVLWRGWNAVYESTAHAAQLVVEEFLHETSATVQHSILDVMRPFVFGEPAGDLDILPRLGSIDAARFQASIDLLVINGVIDQPVRAIDLLDAGALSPAAD